MNSDQKGRGTGSRDTAQAGRPGLRGLRASVFAVVCVLAALGMHVLAGGPIAGLGTVVVATAATGAGAFALARRRRSTGTLLAASFAAQYGMHQLFTSSSAVHHPSHVDHHGGGLYGGLGMLIAHVLVAAVSAWWLDRGETALALLLRLLACSLPGLWALLTARPTPPRRSKTPLTAGSGGVLTSQVLAWALCRRGPPRQGIEPGIS
ncbi:hypothetical protein FXF51_17465 [Nonomuraea sp. PA05]|uniref:hypothetical protein n=1 Tax=Nonomuraea sp. PA05 TaxID=2604466 RepID=UPI0011D7ADDA|nr:hypothetical protein [Nonomuraea sp. PA05]TYB65990.1 hypothetical protein FXF51_17465 [Nonomuraea sp. PA05]